MSASVPEPRTDAWPLACPVCGSSLWRSRGTLACSAGHSFDVAREGYVNLLLSQHRTRGIDGDVPDMLQARRRFLESGHFDQLLDVLATDVGDLLADPGLQRADPTRGACVLEVGCGEGYYIGSVAQRLGATDPRTTFVGVDLSKSAASLAAKRYPQAMFVVADVHRRIYLRNSAVSVLLDVFAPRNPAEFARVLEPGGFAIIVIPTASHLRGVQRELGLLGIQEDKEARVIERFGDGFRLVNRREVEFPLELSADTVSDLVHMGPSHWHVPSNASLSEGEPMTAKASFVILRFQRTEDAV